MYESYADVLESYMIAEEGFGDTIKKAGKLIANAVKKLIERIKNIIFKLKNRSSKENTAINERKETSRYDRELCSEFSKAIKNVGKLNIITYNTISKAREREDTGDAVTNIRNIGNELARSNERIDVLIDNGGVITNDYAKELESSLSSNIKFLEHIFDTTNKATEDFGIILNMCINENNKLISKISRAIK